MEDYIIWLIVIVFFLIAEALTMGLYTIWFSIGATVALILSLFHVHIVIQILAFFIVSIMALIFIYPLVRNKLNFGKTKTNADALIGKIGIVIEEINNLVPTGLTKVDGQVWTSRNSLDGVIEKGKKVRIDTIQGVKLIVTEMK